MSEFVYGKDIFDIVKGRFHMKSPIQLKSVL